MLGRRMIKSHAVATDNKTGVEATSCKESFRGAEKNHAVATNHEGVLCSVRWSRILLGRQVIKNHDVEATSKE